VERRAAECQMEAPDVCRSLLDRPGRAGAEWNEATVGPGGISSGQSAVQPKCSSEADKTFALPEAPCGWRVRDLHTTRSCAIDEIETRKLDSPTRIWGRTIVRYFYPIIGQA
jgi:hypothetical protein